MKYIRALILLWVIMVSDILLRTMVNYLISILYLALCNVWNTLFKTMVDFFSASCIILDLFILIFIVFITFPDLNDTTKETEHYPVIYGLGEYYPMHPRHDSSQNIWWTDNSHSQRLLSPLCNSDKRHCCHLRRVSLITMDQCHSLKLMLFVTFPNVSTLNKNWIELNLRGRRPEHLFTPQ